MSNVENEAEEPGDQDLGEGAEEYKKFRTDEPETYEQNPERAHDMAKSGDILETMAVNAEKSGRSEIAAALRLSAKAREDVAGETFDEITDHIEKELVNIGPAIANAATADGPRNALLTSGSADRKSRELIKAVYELAGVSQEEKDLAQNKSEAPTNHEGTISSFTDSRTPFGGVLRESRHKGSDGTETVGLLYLNSQFLENEAKS